MRKFSNKIKDRFSRLVNVCRIEGILPTFIVGELEICDIETIDWDIVFTTIEGLILYLEDFDDIQIDFMIQECEKALAESY